MARYIRKGFYKGQITKKGLIQLRKDIYLNSLFVSDYENSLGIDANQVCNFFDGFVSFISELMTEDGIDAGGDAFWEHLNEYDTDDNLIEWYNCFDQNPFTEFVD